MDRLAILGQVYLRDDIDTVGPAGSLVDIAGLATDTIGPGEQHLSLRTVLFHPTHTGG